MGTMSEATRIKRRGYQAAYYQRNRERILGYNKDCREHYKALGICPVCKEFDATPGKVLCENCKGRKRNEMV